MMQTNEDNNKKGEGEEKVREEGSKVLPPRKVTCQAELKMKCKWFIKLICDLSY